MENCRFILGKEVKELEDKLAEYVGAKHAVGMASGTDALLVPLIAAGIGAGDEVITTPFTFIATAEVIAILGAKPVFVDIDEKNYNIDVSEIESKITKNTKAIIPVSLYGQCADMDAINSIAAKRGILVIEDACQSFGAIYKGKKSCGISTVGATSFFPSKPLGCYGDGGMVFVNDDELAEKVRQVGNHGQNARYRHKHLGLNARLDTMQAAVLLAKFAHFEDEANKRFEIGKKYNALFAGSKAVTPTIESYTDRHVFAQYSIRVKNRDKVVENLNAASIPSAVHYPIPIHLQEAYAYLGYKAGDFPVSERTSNEIMSLPMHPFLKESDQKLIVGKVLEAAD
jgi:UDP-2-acetamido-2-deoxy-ribo-hexuluronate aminotransferase